MKMTELQTSASAATASAGGLKKATDSRGANGVKQYDEVITRTVDYVYDYEVDSPTAWNRATAALLDSMGAAFESVSTSPECALFLGPTYPTPDIIENGFKVPGTNYQLDMVKGAFDMGAMIQYMNHNDAFLGREWGHPSNNLGAILATADVLTRVALSKYDEDHVLTMRHVLVALIKAYEIQGCIQIKNAFNKIGLDEVILVKVASTAVVSELMGLTKDQAKSAVSHAWVDGHPLRTYRQAPNVCSRKNWSAGDACMRAVHLALMAKKGMTGVKSALDAPRSGFYDVLFQGNQFQLPRPFGTFVIENVLFKIGNIEAHGVTAVEAALTVAKELKEKKLSASDIQTIKIRTQEPAMAIMNKQGPLNSPSDRDHSIPYIVSMVLLKGSELESKDFNNDSTWTKDPRVEELKDKISIKEDAEFTKNYQNPELRSMANAIKVQMNDGSELEEVAVYFPVGHARRRETLEEVEMKARKNLGRRLNEERVEEIVSKTKSMEFFGLPVSEFVDLFVPEKK
ncbi:2-methylcitrate dehydratase protein [Rutstroemia sp. NJR-2017a WRK4]|nr:2-methylcitrate dehydratase protein [Rutstroemia sp. NJR-2017a WRK4]